MNIRQKTNQELIKTLRKYGSNKCKFYLRGADFRGADFRGADLRGADLRGANFRGADLRGADFRGADFRGAYLRGAYFRGADLRDVKDFLSFIGGKDFAVFQISTQILQIGCITKHINEWLAEYVSIGKENNYTEKQIELYHQFIIICKGVSVE
jgi:hypothetical protein